jgi:peptidoglycan/xylan/chitin deacetylase (PgdA/CDA1 family)
MAKALPPKSLKKVKTQIAALTQETNYIKRLKNIKPIVSFLADDGNIEDYNILKPISAAKGIPFSLAVTTNVTTDTKIFSDVNISKLRELVDVYGFEVMSHTADHIDLSTLTYAQQVTQLLDSKNSIIAKGFEVHSIAYPYGGNDANTLKAVPLHYECAYVAGTNLLNDSPLSTFKLNRIQFDPSNANNNLTWYKAKVDEAVSKKQWIIFMLHTSTTLGWLDASQQQMLIDLIDYIQSISVDIMTCYDAFLCFKNVYETESGDYSHGVKGNAVVDGVTTLNSFNLSKATVDDTTKMSGFPYGVSYKTFTVAQAYPFPESSGGILITYNLGAVEQSYQEWHPYNSKNVYWRHYQVDTSWTAWDVTLPVLSISIAQQSLNFGEIPSLGYVDKTVTVVGCTFDDYAIVNPKTALAAGLIFNAFIVAADTVTIRVFNITGSAITDSGRNWRIKVIKR